MKKILLIISLLFAFTTYAGTPASVVIDNAHQHVHAGKHFFATYSVADIGAATTPNDTMTLSFVTDDEKVHFVWAALCSSGARVRFIRGKTGGGIDPTGTIPIFNSDENSSYTSSIKEVSDTTADVISYDATLFTGGTTLIDQYIGVNGLGNSFSGGTSRGDEEIILKKNTAYQLSIFETDNVPCTLQLSWYE